MENHGAARVQIKLSKYKEKQKLSLNTMKSVFFPCWWINGRFSYDIILILDEFRDWKQICSEFTSVFTSVNYILHVHLYWKRIWSERNTLCSKFWHSSLQKIDINHIHVTTLSSFWMYSFCSEFLFKFKNLI